jgi:hypothetical protein
MARERVRGMWGLLNELLLGGRDAGDLGHLHLDVLDGVATGDGKRERGSISFDEELHTCVVAKTSEPVVSCYAVGLKYRFATLMLNHSR